MNLSFAMCDSAKESHRGYGKHNPRGDVCAADVSGTPVCPLLTAPVARGQKPPVGPALSDDGCTVNIRKNAVCRCHVIERRDHGAVRHRDDHRRTVLHIDQGFPCALLPAYGQW